MTRKLLLADDSVTIQKVVELTFADGNYQVQCVSNGKAAVQKIQDDRPDILLCDVIMPEMNGYDVAAFVKRNPAYSAIPVILLTGTFEPFDEEKARLSGADSYITKPFDSKMLVDKVEELLSKRVAFDASATGVAQVFHSRTEFTLGAPEASSDLEFPVAHPEAQEGQLLHAERELLPPEADESPFAATEQEPAVEEGHRTFHAEPESLDFRQALPEAAPIVEALTSAPVPAVADLGLASETEIPEAAFEGILEPESPQGPFTAEVSSSPPPPPPVPSAPHAEVLIAPADDETWPLETPVPETSAPMTAPVQESVSGAEDWGEGQTLGGPSEAMPDVPGDMEVSSVAPAIQVEPAPPGMEPAPPASESLVVHDLTEQQSMVAEAQASLEQAPTVHPDVPFMVEPPEPVTGAYEVSTPAKDPGEPWETIPEEQPLQPEEGVETDLTMLAPSVSPLAAVGFAPEQVKEIAPAAAHEETASSDTGAFPEPSEEPRGAESLPEPEPAAAPAAPAPVLDRAALEGEVRRTVEDLLPGLVAAALPGILHTRLDETLPGLARAHAAETVPDLVRQAVGDALPAMVPAAIGPAVPGHVRSVAEEMAPRIIEETVTSLAAPMMEKLVREMLPDMVRQVAWEVIPELAESIIKRRIQELESEAG